MAHISGTRAKMKLASSDPLNASAGAAVAPIRLPAPPDTGTSSFSPTSALTAGVDGLLDEARIARHLAAPPEPALAVDLLLDDSSVVAPAAAEQLTALDPGTSRVALATGRPQRAGLPIRLAEVRRVLAVDQVEPTGRLDRRALGNEAVPVVAGDDLGRAVEGLLQAVADLPERRHLAPTSAHRAGAGEPVALALGPHEIPYSLRSECTQRLGR